MGKILIYVGIVLIITGLILTYGGKFIGKIPGDIVVKRDNFTFYFPWVTSIVISLILSLIFYIIQKLR